MCRSIWVAMGFIPREKSGNCIATQNSLGNFPLPLKIPSIWSGNENCSIEACIVNHVTMTFAPFSNSNLVIFCDALIQKSPLKFSAFHWLFEGEALEQITLTIWDRYINQRGHKSVQITTLCNLLCMPCKVVDAKGGINPCKVLLSIYCIVDAKGGLNPCKFLQCILHT